MGFAQSLIATLGQSVRPPGYTADLYVVGVLLPQSLWHERGELSGLNLWKKKFILPWHSNVYLINCVVFYVVYLKLVTGMHRIVGSRILQKKPHSVFGGMSEKQGRIYILYIF